MLLKGSCHCGTVRFQLNSAHPYPFNYCYCSICRKTQGGGGFAINISGDAESLEVEGEDNIKIYQAKVDGKEEGEAQLSPAKRHFCSTCGSYLWAWDPRWPELLHPFASAIDTPLPGAPERTHLMLGSKVEWVPVDKSDKDQTFDGYPSESIADWHQRLGLET